MTFYGDLHMWTWLVSGLSPWAQRARHHTWAQRDSCSSMARELRVNLQSCPGELSWHHLRSTTAWQLALSLTVIPLQKLLVYPGPSCLFSHGQELNATVRTKVQISTSGFPPSFCLRPECIISALPSVSFALVLAAIQYLKLDFQPYFE